MKPLKLESKIIENLNYERTAAELGVMVNLPMSEAEALLEELVKDGKVKKIVKYIRTTE